MAKRTSPREMTSSQKPAMASLPRRPWPSGFNGEGPMGSSTTASSVKRASHASRSPASTAAIDRCDATRAGCSAFTRTFLVPAAS